MKQKTDANVRKFQLVVAAVIVLISVYPLGPSYAQQPRKNSPASSAVSDGNIYQNIAVCEEYTDFLNQKLVTDVSRCSSSSKFLIQNSDLDPLRFMSKFHEKYTRSSPFEVLSRGMIFVIEGNASATFAVLDTASTRVYSAFQKIGDDPRTVLYSELADKIKIEALKAEIGTDSTFLSVYPVPKLGEILGPEYAFFGQNDSRADIQLICLLRADNLRVSVVQVITSPRFLNCINNFGE